MVKAESCSEQLWLHKQARAVIKLRWTSLQAECIVLAGENAPEDEATSLTPLRQLCTTTFIVAGGYDRELGNRAVETGHGDAVRPQPCSVGSLKC